MGGTYDRSGPRATGQKVTPRGRKWPRRTGCSTGSGGAAMVGMYGPDVTFLGVPRCDLTDREALRAADVVIVGAPYDAGASYRAGARFGPQAIRMTDYLPHDASRPHLALR